MHQPLPNTVPAPRFYLTGRQPFRPGVILLATLAAIIALTSILSALRHNAHSRLVDGRDPSRRASASGAPSSDDDKDDDPNQVDTIVLGDPSDAPVPGRRGDHVSPVHATILVRLPRFGDQYGLIPDTPAGQLLYAWLAAFNQASYPALLKVLPGAAPAASASAQMELRKQTGGFNLLSAKEVQPGILVFRLRDQTLEATEALGTLQLRPNSNPAAIQSFSLRAVPVSPSASATSK